VKHGDRPSGHRASACWLAHPPRIGQARACISANPWLIITKGVPTGDQLIEQQSLAPVQIGSAVECPEPGSTCRTAPPGGVSDTRNSNRSSLTEAEPPRAHPREYDDPTLGDCGERGLGHVFGVDDPDR